MVHPLDYQPIPPRHRRRAARLHFAIVAATTLLYMLVLGLLYHPVFTWYEFQFYFGGGIIGTPAAPIALDSTKDFDRLVYAVQASGYFFILILTQWLLLKRLNRWKLTDLGGGKLTPRDLLLLGLPAMLLSIGLLATLMEIPDWWFAWTMRSDFRAKANGDFRQNFVIVWIVMALVWALWAVLFWIYGRHRQPTTAVGKILRGLLAGSILETLVAAAAHAWVIRHRGSDCYCTRGSYTGMVFGLTVLVWLFGPGMWFLLEREKHRLEKLL